MLDSATSSNHRFVTTRSPNFVEVAVTTEAVLEAARARHTVRDERFAPVVPFLDQRLAHAEPVTLDGGASIGAPANLPEARDLPRPLLPLRPGSARRPPLGAPYSHKPMFRHSSAGTLRPVRMISSARPWPTIRGNRTVPPSISGTPQRRQ